MNRRHHPMKALAGVAALAVSLTGCATGSPEYDARFGEAVRTLNVQQRIDPKAAERHADTPMTADGRHVREAVDRVVESFRAPPAPTIVNLGVGAGR
jgi:type IV pilus biogenesis protein CpaD/CtpE